MGRRFERTPRRLLSVWLIPGHCYAALGVAESLVAISPNERYWSPVDHPDHWHRFLFVNEYFTKWEAHPVNATYAKASVPHRH